MNFTSIINMISNIFRNLSDFLVSLTYSKKVVMENTSTGELFVGCPNSCGLDLPVCESITVLPGDTVKISHNLKIKEMPSNMMAMIAPRSSTNSGGKIAASIGIIDSSYRGDIKSVIRNYSDEIVDIESGDRLTQLIFLHCLPASEVVCNNVSVINRERGANGFGSSDEFVRNHTASEDVNYRKCDMKQE